MIPRITFLRSLIPAIVYLCCITLHAQSNVDSLGTVLSQTDISIEDRIVTMCRLAQALPEADTEKAIRTTQQALHLGKGLADGKYEALAYGTLVELYHRHGDHIQAQVALDSALWFSNKTDDAATKGFVFLRKAWLESRPDKPVITTNAVGEKGVTREHQPETMNAVTSNLWLMASAAALIVVILVALYFIFKASRLQATVALLEKQVSEKDKGDSALHTRLKTLEDNQRLADRHEAVFRARTNAAEAARQTAEQLRKVAEQQLQETEQQLQHERQEREQVAQVTVEQKNELLKVIRKKISEAIQDRAVLKQVNAVIDQHKKSEEALDKDNGGVESVPMAFFEKLKEKSGDSLSRLDLKHCAFISLGLSNKEIAQRMGVVPKSVLMSRYRIKQKLALPKEEDLDHYIRTLSK
ncbi:helix-turn-helix transcriptional regulator [Chryseolinea lacunae]|uniref:HTH luxR-type domain-containing protein n=1 Tax=Chryseolinea lacunae TaxID=2801331 RepID=A0ABS1KMX8_9BACT|nr:LuxR C-terminal-related transcriptional regulator [Chryseolinea lacunae]MBL0740801.1 hypothetical protein [Chryseolinea lacunae]